MSAGAGSGARQEQVARLIVKGGAPEGRRPVWIQSRFIRCTKRSADMDTKCVLSPNSSLDAKRWM